MTKNIEPIYIDRKARGNQLTAEEFNKIPEKVNELVKAQNAEEERTKGIIAKNRPSRTDFKRKCGGGFAYV